jgi:hypothetical protein
MSTTADLPKPLTSNSFLTLPLDYSLYENKKFNYNCLLFQDPRLISREEHNLSLVLPKLELKYNFIELKLKNIIDNAVFKYKISHYLANLNLPFNLGSFQIEYEMYDFILVDLLNNIENTKTKLLNLSNLRAYENSFLPYNLYIKRLENRRDQLFYNSCILAEINIKNFLSERNRWELNNPLTSWNKQLGPHNTKFE